jgi:hypothetical protein
MRTRKASIIRRGCMIKEKYNKNSAYAVAKRMNKRGGFVHAYKCEFCDGWHVGKPYKQTRIMMAFDRLMKLRNNIPGYI